MHSHEKTDTLPPRLSKNRSRITLAFAIAAAQTIFAAPAIAADYYDALAAYDSQNFGKSFALFSKSQPPEISTPNMPLAGTISSDRE